MIDCFMFLNEFDMLEIRLNSLEPYVDRFVLVEAATTFSGHPKPLYYADNKERYKGFPITHLVVDDFIPTMTAAQREAHQRDYLMRGVATARPDDLILCSDVDEIPNLATYDGATEGVFRQREYCYYLNVFSGKRRVKGTAAIRRRNLDTTTFSHLRLQQKSLPVVLRHGGWHFTFMGDANNVMYQMEAGCHCLDGVVAYRNHVVSNREALRSPFYGVWSSNRRRRRQFVIEEPNGPQWLLDNRERYPHLWL